MASILDSPNSSEYFNRRDCSGSEQPNRYQSARDDNIVGHTALQLLEAEIASHDLVVTKAKDDAILLLTA